MTHSTPVWQRSPGTGWTWDGSAAYIALPARMTPFAVIRLSDVGVAIWELIDGLRDEDEIVSEIVRVWEADEADVRPTVASFLDALASQGVVQPSDG
ncbi:PqqD family protein [Microbacterium sp. NPDC007973]|uniref:PqqD family protein n=1 Tax=Microbacterium sp. NPDC007973 TaxID=3364182 RepID=UPI0036E3B771